MRLICPRRRRNERLPCGKGEMGPVAPSARPNQSPVLIMPLRRRVLNGNNNRKQFVER